MVDIIITLIVALILASMGSIVFLVSSLYSKTLIMYASLKLSGETLATIAKGILIVIIILIIINEVTS